MQNIDEIINIYGAKTVYQACHKAMSGQPEDLMELGMSIQTLGNVYRAMTRSYEQLSDKEKAQDKMDTYIALSNISQ